MSVSLLCERNILTGRFQAASGFFPFRNLLQLDNISFLLGRGGAKITLIPDALLLLVPDMQGFDNFKREADMKKALLVIALCGVVLSPVLGQAVKKSKDAKKTEVREQLDDKALGDAAFMQLEAATNSGGYEELREVLIKSMLARLSCGALDDLDGLKGMLFCLRASIYLDAISKIKGGEKLSEWLVENPQVSRCIFRAMEDYPPQKIGEALGNMLTLIVTDERAVREYPDLAAAFATSYPLNKYVAEQPSPCTMVDAFKYYTSGSNEFRCDLKKLPFELARYLADSRLSIDERKWAAKTFANYRDLIKIYKKVPLDKEHLEKGAPKKLAGMPYTLQNIAKAGGDYKDSAYFTTEVSKALGQPASVVFTDLGGDLMAAWPVVLVPGKGKDAPYWDKEIGNTKSLTNSTSYVFNAATGQPVLLGEFYLAGEVAAMPVDRREDAYVAVSLCTLIDYAIQNAVEPDMDMLRKIAEAYNNSLPENEAAKAIKLDQFEQKIECNSEMIFKLLNIALEKNIAYPDAWGLLLSYSQSGRFENKQSEKLVDILTKQLARAYPDYTCLMVQRIAAVEQEIPARIKLYKQASASFKDRPDLLGWMLIGLGDDYLADGQKKQALTAYQQAATKCIRFPTVCVSAAEKAEQMLVGAGQTGAAVKMYNDLFKASMKFKGEAVDVRCSAFYQVGLKLIKLYEDAGKGKDADKVRSRLGIGGTHNDEDD